MKVTDDQVIEAWIDTQNYAEAGRRLGVAGQTVRIRVLHLRAQGVELPPSQKVGYALTPERAREIGKLRHDVET